MERLQKTERIAKIHKSYQQSSFATSLKVKKRLNDKEQLSRRRHSEYDVFTSKRYPDATAFKTLGDKTSKSEDFEFLLSLYDKMIHVNNVLDKQNVTVEIPHKMAIEEEKKGNIQIAPSD